MTWLVHRDAHMVMEDMKRAISELEQESSLPAVGVELVDNELAMLYMNSKKSEVHTHTHSQSVLLLPALPPYLTFSHLADYLIQSDLKYRDIPLRQVGWESNWQRSDE